MAINESGGVVHQVDPFTLLQRFLILGDQTGDYYVSAKQLEVQNLENVALCWKLDGQRTLDMIYQISTTGRAVSNDTCLAALAWGFVHEDVEMRRAAAQSLNAIARTLSHLLTFVDYVTRLRGWGRVLKNAVANWFQSRQAKQLGYQFIKYQQRKGWSVGDLLRLSHPTPTNKMHDGAYFCATGGDPYQLQQSWYEVLPDQISATKQLREMYDDGQTTLHDMIRHITKYKLPWEAIPSELLRSASLWMYIAKDMPNEAFLHNIPRMAALNLLGEGSLFVHTAQGKLMSMERMHPIRFLTAWVAYKRGYYANHERREGEMVRWRTDPRLLQTLEQMFFKNFSTIKATGKRIVLGVDRSGSMKRSMVQGIPDFSSVEAATALAASILRVEKHAMFVAFNTQAERMRHMESPANLTVYTEAIRNMAKGGTNCAAPIQYCIDNNVDPDAIIILTDAQHWHGPQPDDILQQLRNRVQHPVKLVVVCTTPNKWTVVCPDDPDVMNIVGFDSHALRLIHDFISDDSDTGLGDGEDD